ncbi:MAG: amino acid adenylation domain-containing protein, partial [Bradymonadaceae bacterium]
MLGAEDHSKLVENWGQGRSVERPAQTVHGLFENRVQEYPERTAVVFEGGEWTYRELYRRAKELAGHLQLNGMTPGTKVGLNLDRSPHMIQALFAVMMTGGIYVPLEPRNSRTRNEYIADDAGVEFVIVGEGGSRQWGDRDFVELSGSVMFNHDGELSDTSVSPEHSIYILYTSGTTGEPKGVELPHRAVVNHCQWRHEAFGLDQEDAFLFKSPLGFDASVLEIYPTLTAGGTLVCARPGGEKDPAYLSEIISTHRVNRLFAVPAQLEQLLNQQAFKENGRLTDVFCGAEAWSASLRERFFEAHPDAQLYNAYGPTEACITATVWECRSDEHYQVNPIGQPVGNHRLRVVDQMLRTVPQGSEGELHVSGPGLAHGYWGMPKTTALAFVPDASKNKLGSRAYRTGDLVRWDHRGNLEYLARKDHQVQLQGVRTELPEVESILEEVDGVEMAAVKVLEVGRNRRAQGLAAYVVGEDVPDVERLERHVSNRLQQPQRPKFWLELESLPINQNGKIERSELPEPDRRPGETRCVEPRNAVESAIVDYWAEADACERTREHRAGGEEFFFVDSPPYTSGAAHMGTTWNKTLKDAYIRYKRMQGYDVTDRPGYDMH